MKIKIYLSLVLFGSLLLFKSCIKDPQIDTNKSQLGITPYIIERNPGYPPLLLPIDNPLTEQGVALGRMLFFDPILSKDSTISCNTCHIQNRAFAESRKTSRGIRGQIGTRNAMPLYNLMWQKRFFWDGRENILRDQILGPIQEHNEMDMNLFNLALKLNASNRYLPLFKRAFGVQNITPSEVSKALEQFLITMISFNSKIDQLRGRTDSLNVVSASALRGLNLFMKPVEDGGADCFHCHSNMPFFGVTSAAESMSNNGLDEDFIDKGFGNVTGRPTDNGKFKIPSLRNVALSAPYMHDGRFATLEDVVDFYSDQVKFNSPNLDINIAAHGKQLSLTQQQKDDLVEFLRHLTDNEFINNPKFKNPF